VNHPPQGRLHAETEYCFQRWTRPVGLKIPESIKRSVVGFRKSEIASQATDCRPFADSVENSRNFVQARLNPDVESETETAPLRPQSEPSKSRADPLEDTHQQRLHGVRPDDTPARPEHTVSPKLSHDEYEFQHGCGNGGEEPAAKKKLLRAWRLNERCLPEPD